MKRTLVSALLPLIAIPLAVGAGVAGATEADQGCIEPVPQRNYEAKVFRYGLEVDYTGCAWWDDTPIVLESSLSRLDGEGETAAMSISLCAHAIAANAGEGADGQSGTVTAQEASDRGGAGDGDEGATRNGICSTLVWLDHAPVEAALYRGRITYPWDGGEKTIGFTALCGPTTGCIDLPADPSPALASAGALYDTVGGDE